MKCQTNVSFKATVLMLTLKKVRFRQRLRTFPVIVNNNYGKMSFTIEGKALIINN
jgi:hypothetical protein